MVATDLEARSVVAEAEVEFGIAAYCIVIDVAIGFGNMANFLGNGDLGNAEEGFLSLFMVYAKLQQITCTGLNQLFRRSTFGDSWKHFFLNDEDDNVADQRKKE